MMIERLSRNMQKNRKAIKIFKKTTTVVLTIIKDYGSIYSKLHQSFARRIVKMIVKLFDSELKVMNVLWNEGDCTAKHISNVLKEEIGWNMNTTYTLIKRCINKGAIERSEPNFMCHALIPKEKVQIAETNEFIDKMFDGSIDKMFAALIGNKQLSEKQIEKLKNLIKNLE